LVNEEKKMNQSKSIQQLCEILWQIENDFNLLETEIQNVKVWQYIRMQTYYTIAEKSGTLQTPHAQKQTIYGQLKKILTYAKSLLFYNPFFIFTRDIDEIVIDHPRPKQIDGRNIDIYTHYYLKELEQKNKHYLVLERPFLNTFHTKTNTKHRKYLDTFSAISSIKSKIFPLHLDPNEIILIKQWEEVIQKRLGVKLEMQQLIRAAVSKYKNNYMLYRYLFSKLRPKKLVLVVSYAYGDAIRAAKDLGIETVEIQHGTLSKYHLGYSFPNRTDDLDYFPDKFIAWGEYWKNLKVIPLSEKNIIIGGFTHFNYLKERYKIITQKQDQILILSQGALGPQIADKILTQIEYLKDYSIVYKLHPGEYSRWKEYTSLLKLSKLPNVKIVKDEDIYKLFSESAFQVGVFSTALYEGLGFDCKTILLELPGIEYMSDLIKNNTVKVLQGNEHIIDLIKSFDQTTNGYKNISNEMFGNSI